MTYNFRSSSDVDLALLFFPGQPFAGFAKTIFEHSANIESITGHAAHFSLLSSRNLVFSKEVITKGRLIVCNDTFFCKSFSMHTLSMYVNLNQERSKILEQYLT